MEGALPSTFVLEVTKRCNHRCLYCYVAGGTFPPEVGGAELGEMSAAEVKDVIAQLAEEVPLRTIAISGGEPLLREDLCEILAFIHERGIDSVLITNGTLLTRERVKATRVGGAYEVTLLSHRHEVHDRLANRIGAWEAAVDGMANVSAARGRLVAAFVATRLNAPDLSRTAELAIALGAEALMYNRLNLGAHNFRYADLLLPPPEMIRENLDVLEEIGERYGLPIAVSVVIEPCVVDIAKYRHVHFGWCPLGGEGAYYTIDPHGNVRICNHSSVVLGNLRQDRFLDLYHHPYVRRFRETWPRECADCAPDRKAICGGGCKAAAEQCFGTLDRVDPFVTRNQSVLMGKRKYPMLEAIGVEE